VGISGIGAMRMSRTCCTGMIYALFLSGVVTSLRQGFVGQGGNGDFGCGINKQEPGPSRVRST